MHPNANMAPANEGSISKYLLIVHRIIESHNTEEQIKLWFEI